MQDTESGGPIARITRLTRELARPHELEELLQLVVDGAREIVPTENVSLRLLDPSRELLVALCRAGKPMHLDPDVKYRTGEGLVGWIVEHAETLRSADATADPRFLERDDRSEEITSFLGVPIISGTTCIGTLSAVSPQPDLFSKQHEELLSLLASVAGPFIETRRLAWVTSVDPLTSALSRRGLDVALPDARLSECGIALPISVVMVDLDEFKKVNDEYGHVVGDQVLREVSKTLASILGAGDAVVRYGGEEFLLILPGVDASGAEHMAEDARRSVQLSSHSFHSVRINVTASFGVAERKPGESRPDLIKRADIALRQAKQAGRNRVVLAS